MTSGPPIRPWAQGLLRHRRSLGHVLVMLSLAAIVFATLLPSEQIVSSSRWCVVCGSLGGVDIVLNVALFMPLGCGLAMIGWRPAVAIAAAACLALAIEAVQYVAIAGRDASIGDLIMNSLGGAIGFSIGAAMERLVAPATRTATRLSRAWLCLWLVVQSIASFSLKPAPTPVRYYGQIKRSLGGRAPYAGDVPLATIDSVRIPNTAYDRARLPRPDLGNPDGARVRVNIVPREPTMRLVPIVRIADAHMDEVLLVGQDRTDLVFGIRTGAVPLHLRPVYFALRDVFPERATGHDTVRFEARYAARHVELNADAGGRRIAMRVKTTPATGWRLLLPFRAYADAHQREAFLAVLWLVTLVAPAGYWHAFATRKTETSVAERRRARFLFGVVVIGGLLAIPAAFGLALPGATEWGGAVVAVALGLLIARFAVLQA